MSLLLSQNDFGSLLNTLIFFKKNYISTFVQLLSFRKYVFMDMMDECNQLVTKLLD